ncbi:MAG: ribosomal protein S18-alanine N-acetyltransferase [Gammaproteobacteria bacterium]|nr:ribosomal protein S18-alanine N-acetyltransferase [Gammaproteobacteria bacterium]MCW8988593.1 ribosomal protein S18-alanine N-acetyltransferase [Gammaproteobacteria bacterium]
MSAILQSSNPDFCFRKMLEADLNEILAIEESVYSFPWTRTIFHDCLNVGYFCWVLQHQDKIVAYSIMSVAADESHLLTIVVAKDEQGKGYGKKLLDEMIRLASKNGAKAMYLEVRMSNKTAIQLYHQRGFNELGIRNNYYPAEQGREDALILALDLSF